MSGLRVHGLRIFVVVLVICCSSTPSQGASPAPSPSASKAFTDGASPLVTNWSEAQKATQRIAGAKLAQNISQALVSNASSYRIPPGTYRTSQSIGIFKSTNFTLFGNGAELIAENGSVNLDIFNNTNFVLQGPLVLDGVTLGFTQGIIVDTNEGSTITVQIMPGYGKPVNWRKMMFFDPEGNAFPLYQVTPTSVAPSTSDSNVFTFSLDEIFWTSYDRAREDAIALGNMVAIELLDLAGGINTNSNNGINLTDVSLYANVAIFGLGETGPVVMNRIHGIRRPGTNRLMAGGHVSYSITGGSFYMRDSEVSYHFDDLTDIQSGLYYSFAQISPTSVYAGFVNYNGSVGDTLHFYDVASLQDLGVASITALEAVNDQSTIDNFQAGLTDMDLLNWTVSPLLISLDSDLQMPSNYALFNTLQKKPTSMVFENNYFHDGLAAGINAKGAELTIIRNNTIRRSGYRAASVGFDPYWWEGGVPSNIIIEGNYAEDVPFSKNAAGQAISTYVDSSTELLQQGTGTPMHNVTIRDNIIVNPRVAGIGVVFTANATVINNTIINPVADVADSSLEFAVPYASPAGIFLDCISGSVVVSNNRILDADPDLVTQGIGFGYNSTLPLDLEVCSNSLANANGSSTALPDSLWSRAYYDSPLMSYGPTFGYMVYPANGDRMNTTFALPYSTQPGLATFNFTGTRAQWLSCTGQAYGTAMVALDGVNVSAVDASVTRIADIDVDPNIGFCNQVLYDSGDLAQGEHSVQITVLGTPGVQSVNGSTTIAVLGFSYLTGQNQCTLNKTPSSAVTSFQTLASQGPGGPAPSPLHTGYTVLSQAPSAKGPVDGETGYSNTGPGRPNLNPMLSPASSPYGVPSPQSQHHSVIQTLGR